MILTAAFLLAYAGFAALCVSMTKHQVETVGRRLDVREQSLAKAGGAAGLAAAFACAVVAEGWRFGSVLWSGVIMLAALALALLLAYRPRTAARAAAVSAYFAPLLIAAWALVTFIRA
ncbi:DUF3325 family protein [Phenylobacterium sp.]|uniref:DUF3325 family protein n=1 Tax=Phenylobacterium sp. TaxID=1871053 RepID=UPI00273043E9|nr:DUF3325 family protein [Phenylobacterium sp.]MDP1617956.1 DUF3325 family protein [Phenylobacterium sp.]MDP1985834.1 DUF3325 family protein [Phenylobacterium sp.]